MLKNKSRFILIVLLVLAVITFYLLAYHPKSPLPREWNPRASLQISDKATLITDFKLTMALASESGCLSVLEQDSASLTALSDLKVNQFCGIENRVRLSGVGEADLRSVETTCPIALRTAIWERHSLQPAAKKYFDSSVKEILHFSSYNCRKIRGSQNRWSTHSRAESIDIAGFVLDDGRTITLLRDWNKQPDFFEEITAGACRWFKTVLSPNYNAAHRDHFHLQSVGWGTCR